jgi:hypothetical protein
VSRSRNSANIYILDNQVKSLLRLRVREIMNLLASIRGFSTSGKRYQLPFGPKLPNREPWMAEVLNRLLPKLDEVFLDIGANRGQTLLHFRSVAGRHRYIGL